MPAQQVSSNYLLLGKIHNNNLSLVQHEIAHQSLILIRHRYCLELQQIKLYKLG